MLVSFSSPTFFLLTIRTISNRNIAHAHQSRAEPILEVTTAVGESPTERGEPGGSGKKRAQEPRQRKNVVCFYCRRPGHTQSRCFQRLSQRGKVAYTVESLRS